MVRQHFVAEVVHLLDQQRHQHLLRAQLPAPARVRVLQATGEIGVDQIGHRGVLVEKAANPVQLTCVLVLDCRLDKWELFAYALSHRWCFPF